jgi:hypothetical protein
VEELLEVLVEGTDCSTSLLFQFNQ